MRIAIFAILVFSNIQILKAQGGIKGRITNTSDEPVSFSNIYVPALKTGTSSNIDGFFELNLPQGEWEIMFTYLGYKTESRKVDVGAGYSEINITLQRQNILIKEVKVLASGEDPAYYVMRRAISMAPYYISQVSEYDCKVYLKGSGIIRKVPKMLRKRLKKEGIELNKPFVMESISKVHFELPDKLDQQVISMHSTGDDNNTSPIEMITNNLYQSAEYGVISPLDKNAFKVYKFKLEGVFEDQGRTINKIKVIPKHRGRDLVSGYIYIAENFWNIHSADLELNPPMANIKMRQIYAPVEKNTWMPVSLDFNVEFTGLGFNVAYTYVASVSEYKTTLNPGLDHTILEKAQSVEDEEIIVFKDLVSDEKKEIRTVKQKKYEKKVKELLTKDELTNREMYRLQRLMRKETERSLPPEPLEIKERVKVTGNAVVNDSAFWEEYRPIPLSGEETLSFSEKDSIIEKMNSPEYKDSIRSAQRKFKFKYLLLGKTFVYKDDSTKYTNRFSMPGLVQLSSFSYNTVDGFRYEMDFSYSLTDTSGHVLRAATDVAYAFHRKNFDADLSISYLINSFNMSRIIINGGHVTMDYGSGMSVLLNTVYTLFAEENYKKYYQKDYIQFRYSREIINGMTFDGNVEYSYRQPLQNHASFRIVNWKDKEFTVNIPSHPDMDSTLIEPHRAMFFTFNFDYTPRQRYYLRKTGKYPAESKYPTFFLTYRKAVEGVGGSKADLDYFESGLRQGLNTGFGDFLFYSVKAGVFITGRKVFFADYKQFETNPIIISDTYDKNKFRLIPYYSYATQNWYVEGHISWSTDRLLFKRLPLINNTLIEENLLFNYLTTPDHLNYIEIGYGLSNIFLMFNVEGMVAIENWNYKMVGLRISTNIF